MEFAEELSLKIVPSRNFGILEPVCAGEWRKYMNEMEKTDELNNYFVRLVTPAYRQAGFRGWGNKKSPEILRGLISLK